MDETQEIHPAKKSFSWSASTGIAVTIVIYLVAQLAAGLLIYLYPILRGWSNFKSSQWLDHSVVAQFAFVVLVEAITVWLLYKFLKRYKTNFRALGLLRPKFRDVGYALTGFAVYLPLYVISISIVEAFVPNLNLGQKQQLGFENASGHTLILVFISLVLLPPIVEELLVRGFLYGSLKAHWPKAQAVIVTSALFAVAHLQIGSGAPLLWVAAIDTFILSLVLIYLRDKTGSLAASIMLHMLKNGIAFLSLFIFHLS